MLQLRQLLFEPDPTLVNRTFDLYIDKLRLSVRKETSLVTSLSTLTVTYETLVAWFMKLGRKICLLQIVDLELKRIKEKEGTKEFDHRNKDKYLRYALTKLVTKIKESNEQDKKIVDEAVTLMINKG